MKKAKIRIGPKSIPTIGELVMKNYSEEMVERFFRTFDAYDELLETKLRNVMKSQNRSQSVRFN